MCVHSGKYCGRSLASCSKPLWRSNRRPSCLSVSCRRHSGSIDTFHVESDAAVGQSKTRLPLPPIAPNNVFGGQRCCPHEHPQMDAGSPIDKSHSVRGEASQSSPCHPFNRTHPSAGRVPRPGSGSSGKSLSLNESSSAALT